MRIAWLGPIGDDGVPGLGRALFVALAEAGDEVDLYIDGEYLRSQTSLSELVAKYPNVTAVSQDNPWRWGKWYSRNRVMAFGSGLLARVWVHRQLGRRLIATAPARGYDVIFQFSQTELFELGQHCGELPPIVIHPCSHAAGELYWHRSESKYALQSESTGLHYAARAILWYRARRQRDELTRSSLVIGPSQHFIDLVRRDYRLPGLPVAVLRHSVQRGKFSPSVDARSPERTVRLLFVSRMSTRKGVEMIVSLSHRLADLAGQVRIELVGDKTLWSDYREHLKDLDPSVAEYLGPLPGDQMPQLLREADGLLVPSHYEPGSLVVGEALASGIPVVLSEAVGPGEVLDPKICRVFPTGDLDGFEQAVRGLVADVRENWAELSSLARSQSDQFEPDVVGREFRQILADAGERRS